MKKIFLVVLFLAVIPLAAIAQTGTIKGILLDARNKEAIIGGSVMLKGTLPPVGTSTDIDGNF